MQHLEVVNFNGRMGFASLALLWPSDNDRLKEMLAWHESNGMPVFDPHTHVLEDGGMKQTDWAQLGFKRRVDPTGVLNPGKMRAWEEQAATTEMNDPRGAFAAAYRRGQPIVSSERLGKMEVASHLPYLPAQPAVGLPKRSSDVGFGNPAAFRCFCMPSARRPGVLSVG